MLRAAAAPLAAALGLALALVLAFAALSATGATAFIAPMPPARARAPATLQAHADGLGHSAPADRRRFLAAATAAALLGRMQPAYTEEEGRKVPMFSNRVDQKGEAAKDEGLEFLAGWTTPEVTDTAFITFASDGKELGTVYIEVGR